jgi:hypothetical protein
MGWTPGGAYMALPGEHYFVCPGLSSGLKLDEIDAGRDGPAAGVGAVPGEAMRALADRALGQLPNLPPREIIHCKRDSLRLCEIEPDSRARAEGIGTGRKHGAVPGLVLRPARVYSAR